MANPLINLRVTPDQRTKWKAAAEADGLTLSDWIRYRCDYGPTLSERTAAARSPEIMAPTPTDGGPKPAPTRRLRRTADPCPHPKAAIERLPYGTFCATRLGGCGTKIR